MSRSGRLFEEQLISSIPPTRAVDVGVVGSEHPPSALHEIPSSENRPRRWNEFAEEKDQGMFDRRGGS
jgi:hypothetical protein